MSDKRPFAWWVPINGDTCFFKTYEEAKRERDAFEADFTGEDLAEGHYEPEPLYAAPAEDVQAVGDEPMAWLAQAIGADGGVYRASVSTVKITERNARYGWGEGVLNRYRLDISPLYRRPQRQVVLPERNKATKNLDLEQCGYVDGWNACLDEIERMSK